jgi:Mg2+/Co2+ transporter CorB
MVIALAVLLVVSAFFSIAETSMMAINRYRLRHLAKEGSRAAQLTSELLDNTDKLLGVILLGNNLINAASALIVGEITRRYMGDSQYALLAAGIAATFFILVFSEITPKVIGATYPEPIALGASFLLTPLLKLAYPVVWFVNLFVGALLWLFRLKGQEVEHTRLSMGELRTLVMEGGHYIPAKHRNILGNLFELEDITVDDVMTTRAQIEAIDIEAPIEEIRESLATTNHTRLPVCAGSLDNVIGTLHVRKVLHQTRNAELTRETLKEILREPYFIPEGTPLLTQLQNFQEGHRRLGLVVDEYGEIQGLVSLEDILEEIVGEFTSNSPFRGGLIVDEDETSILVEGRAPLRLLNRKYGLNFPLDGPKTINGLILERLEDIPEPGTSVKISGLPVEIVQTQDRMVRMVRIFHNNQVVNRIAAEKTS